MSWSVWLSLTLCIPMADSVLNTKNCQSLDLRQPNRVIWRNKGQSASLPCYFNVNCSGSLFLWFVFKEHSHYQIDLGTDPPKYSMDGARLLIDVLSVNDSGIYHCAAVFPAVQLPGAQEIGRGTKLAVRGEGMWIVWHILLWLLCVLLAIYSLAIIILITRKKTGKDISICGEAWRSAHQNNNATKTMRFHAVVQELHGRRNLQNNTPDSDHRGQNTAESPQSSPSSDDIYQNL